ncbi:MAG: FMN-binding protein [Ectothiorhodospiraceae bacterium]|nr:FMN-binding protein [Ectothiorhodospiraceae bacterium]
MLFSTTIIILFSYLHMLGPVLGPSAPDALNDAAGEYFGAGCSLSPVTLNLTQSDVKALKNECGSGLDAEDVQVWQIKKGSAVQAYAFIDNVKGKVRQITYTVLVSPDGKVAGMEILKYRESHGGEVGHSMFRDQFTGKSASDDLALGKDIRNISGATISCRSVTKGVKSILHMYSYLKKSGKLQANAGYTTNG